MGYNIRIFHSNTSGDPEHQKPITGEPSISIPGALTNVGGNPLHGFVIGPSLGSINSEVNLGASFQGKTVQYKNASVNGIVLNTLPYVQDYRPEVLFHNNPTGSPGVNYPGIPVILDTPVLGVSNITLSVSGISKTTYIRVLGNEVGPFFDGFAGHSYMGRGSSITSGNSSKLINVGGINYIDSPGISKASYNIKLSLVTLDVVNYITDRINNADLMYVYFQEYQGDSVSDPHGKVIERTTSSLCKFLSPYNLTYIHDIYYDVTILLQEV